MNTTVPVYTFRKGTIPLLVSILHAGTYIPPNIANGMTATALTLADTDWHLERLYNFLGALGASVLVATHSRYVIDLNRPPDDDNLYPGQDTTGLCPIDTFCKEALYQPGRQPDKAEIQRRAGLYWTPYHTMLSEELQRIRQEHGIAMLWDAHSIRSVVPRFFEGRLPDFNIGTASGTSCGPFLAEQLLAIGESCPAYRTVLNGRFRGGYITRHYGDPAQHTHAVQLELAQITYMEENHPYRFDETLAVNVRPVLRSFIEAILAYANNQAI